MAPCGTIGIAVAVAVAVGLGQDVPGRIPCNRAVKRVPGGIVRTGRLASEGF